MLTCNKQIRLGNAVRCSVNFSDSAVSAGCTHGHGEQKEITYQLFSFEIIKNMS